MCNVQLVKKKKVFEKLLQILLISVTEMISHYCVCVCVCMYVCVTVTIIYSSAFFKINYIFYIYLLW
jgi:hypothetical protein